LECGFEQGKSKKAKGKRAGISEIFNAIPSTQYAVQIMDAVSRRFIFNLPDIPRAGS
jgi:hypothetical protein